MTKFHTKKQYVYYMPISTYIAFSAHPRTNTDFSRVANTHQVGSPKSELFILWTNFLFFCVPIFQSYFRLGQVHQCSWLGRWYVCMWHHGSNCSLVPAMDGHTMRCGIISSCQSAATSEIVKCSWASVHRGAALYQVTDLCTKSEFSVVVWTELFTGEMPFFAGWPVH